MCLIAYLPKDKVMSKEEVEKAWRINDDGAGIAFFENGEWKIIKAVMKSEEIIKLIERYKNTSKVVHFRAASAGGVHPELTHPFETHRYILFHNGTWIHWNTFCSLLKLFPIFQKYWKKYNEEMNYNPDLISDTKLLAFLLYLVEEGKCVKKEVEEIIKEAGKIVIIDKKKNKVMFYGNFENDSGRKFSNSSYKGYFGYTLSYGSGIYSGYGNYGNYNYYYGREMEKGDDFDLSESEIYGCFNKTRKENENTNSHENKRRFEYDAF
ncbi:MAG: class II glutamine amidotransferase [Spirochaetes bacterium]|nr:class II glutamine amidotransferase [Spirochaetota bacterium]